MQYNNRNKPNMSVFGCSSTTLLIGFFLMILMISGGLFFIFRYFGLILALGIIIWFFRNFITKDKKEKKSSNQMKDSNWGRNYEQNKNTSYDNIEREFEEVDDE